MPTSPPFFSTLDEYLRQADVDGKLLRGIASGKEDALAALYDAYAPVLATLAVKILWSVTDAEEVVQEVFLETWKNGSTGGDASVYASLVSLARERSLRRVKARGQRKQHHATEAHEAVLLPASGALNADADIDERRTLAGVVRQMAAEEQQVIALAYYEGWIVSEISGLVGRPADVVLSQVSSGLASLNRIVPWGMVSVSSHEADFLKYCASGALGVLDGPDEARFAAHLAAPCETCRSDLRGVRETAALLPLLLAPAPLSPEVKERILFSIRLSQLAAADVAAHEETTEQEEPSEVKEPAGGPSAAEEPPRENPRRPWWTVLGVFVGLVLLVGIVAYVHTLRELVEHQTSFIVDQENAMAKLTTDLDGKSAVLGLLQSPKLEMFRLRGVSGNAASHGKLLWDPVRNEAVLQVSNLRAAPEGKEYRLWFVLRDKDTLWGGVVSLDSADARESFFVVRTPRAVDHSRIDYFALVQVEKGHDSVATGELVMVGAMPGK